jgi:hypothetical protein
MRFFVAEGAPQNDGGFVEWAASGRPWQSHGWRVWVEWAASEKRWQSHRTPKWARRGCGGGRSAVRLGVGFALRHGVGFAVRLGVGFALRHGVGFALRHGVGFALRHVGGTSLMVLVRRADRWRSEDRRYKNFLGFVHLPVRANYQICWMAARERCV